MTRFGFDAERHPPFLTMALGAGSVTPWQMARAISVFANGGYRIEPYLVARITDNNGRLLASAQPVQAGDPSLRAIDPRNAFLMDSMLRDVVQMGTATRARVLKRDDLAGKTGTTNDSIDAWFTGYWPGHRGGGLGRLRPAAQARRPRDRGRPGVADLDRLHGDGAQGRP